MIVNNNRNYNFKGIIDNYDFCHNRAALITIYTYCGIYMVLQITCKYFGTLILVQWHTYFIAFL